MKTKIFRGILALTLSVIYFGCSSKSDDQCQTISCENGGVFINCECDCPDGYTGTNCQTQVTPLSITITKVTLNLFPLTDSNGNAWDAGGDPEARPDVYFKFIKGSSTIGVIKSMELTNAEFWSIL